MNPPPHHELQVILHSLVQVTEDAGPELQEGAAKDGWQDLSSTLTSSTWLEPPGKLIVLELIMMQFLTIGSLLIQFIPNSEFYFEMCLHDHYIERILF